MKFTGILSYLLMEPFIPWVAEKLVINHPVLNIMEGDEKNPARACRIHCRDCLAPVCFDDEIVTDYSALVTKRDWLVHAHNEYGAGAGLVLLLKGFKLGLGPVHSDCV